MDIANKLKKQLNDQEIDLRRHFVTEFYEQYRLNPPECRITHFDETLQLMLELAEFIDYPLDHSTREMMIVAAYTHDLFAYYHDLHHHLAAEYVWRSDHQLLNRLSCRVRWIISQACLEHRRDHQGSFSSTFSTLLHTANYGYPRPVEALVNDRFQCLLKSCDNHHKALQIARSEIGVLYGAGSHDQYPDIYREYFAETLQTRQREAEQLANFS